MGDLMLIVALTVLACLVVGGLGALLLHGLRRSSLRYQLLVAALLPVLAVATTVVINVRLMFLSTHDSWVVLVAVLTAFVVALGGTLLVSRRALAGFTRLGRGVGELVADHGGTAPGVAGDGAGSGTGPGSAEQPLPAELRTALADLADARARLAEARSRERAAEQARRELVSFMSHDLRTPLAGLRALAEALEDGVIADVPRALAHLRGTVARMNVLVDDLFALSRVQGSLAGAPSAAKEHHLVSLAEVVNDVTSEAAAPARSAGVALEVGVPDDDRLAVLGSHDDLTRALANLVANAVRHTDSGGAVTVRAHRAVADDSVRVEVSDQCGGIPDDDLERVFDTGWRGNPARSADDGGAGLGLAIARGVLDAHTGRIGVRNTADGCCFEISLPPAGR